MWKMQTSGTLNTSGDASIYIVDLWTTSTSTIESLNAAGRLVVCAFSAGIWEQSNPDALSFFQTDKGNLLEGRWDAKWIDPRASNNRRLMGERMNLAVSKGCGAVLPSDVENYAQPNTGLNLTATDQIDYNRFLASAAYERQLGIGLRNDVTQLAPLADYFDFAVNERCNELNRCTGYSAFTSRSKAVFNIEYAPSYVNNLNGARDTMCAASTALGLSTQVLPIALDGSFRIPCP